MMKNSLFVIALVLVFFLVSPALALHPELQVPEKVEAKHEACQIMSAIAARYAIEGVFSKEFLEGTQCLTRVELAAALELLSEKLADKVVKEGATAVARKDLDRLADIREELRGEMLLVHTRAFEQRNELLGTLLHPLTRNISLSGQMVGTFQSQVGHGSAHNNAVVGRGDVVFDFKVGENTLAVVDVEATGGDGLDPRIASFSGLNGNAGSTGDRVRFRQAWVEHAMFGDKLIATIGKIDLGNYFDGNNVANDETSQFLSSAFVNNHILSYPSQGPGLRITGQIAEPLTVSIGYGSGDADSDAILDHGFAIAEADCKVKVAGLEGTYRIYGAIDGKLPEIDGSGAFVNKREQKNAWNAGISIDQQLTGKLTVFARYGKRERHAYLTNASWSAGFQYEGAIPGRPADFAAFAYGQILGQGDGMPHQEKLAEWYYQVKVSEKIAIAPVVQYLIAPLGTKSDAVVVGIRSRVAF